MNCVRSVQKPNSSRPMCARKTISVVSSTARSSASGRLDIAVNNAGTEGKPGPITQQTAESYSATFDTNVLGVLLSMKHEARVMQGQRSGTIINISSTYGHEGAAGASIYVGSKHAVEGITKSVALELAESGIRVECGGTWRDRHQHVDPLHGHAREQSGSDSDRSDGPPRPHGGNCQRDRLHRVGGASYITGHVLNVDGGKSH